MVVNDILGRDDVLHKSSKAATWESLVHLLIKCVGTAAFDSVIVAHLYRRRADLWAITRPPCPWKTDL